MLWVFFMGRGGGGKTFQVGVGGESDMKKKKLVVIPPQLEFYFFFLLFSTFCFILISLIKR